MKNNLTIIKIILITILLFISLDLLVGKYVYKKLIRSNFLDIETSFGVRDFGKYVYPSSWIAWIRLSRSGFLISFAVSTILIPQK